MLQGHFSPTRWEHGESVAKTWHLKEVLRTAQAWIKRRETCRAPQPGKINFSPMPMQLWHLEETGLLCIECARTPKALKRKIMKIPSQNQVTLGWLQPTEPKVHIHKRIRILQVKDKTRSLSSFGRFLFQPSLLYIQGKLQSQVHPRWAVGSQMLSFGLKHTESKNQNWLTSLSDWWFYDSYDSMILCYHASCSLELAFVVASLEQKHYTHSLSLSYDRLKMPNNLVKLKYQMRGNAKSPTHMENTCSSLSFPAPNWLHRLKTCSMYVDRPKKMSQPQMVKCILEKAVKCVGIVRRFPLVMDAKSLTVLIYVVLIVLDCLIKCHPINIIYSVDAGFKWLPGWTFTQPWAIHHQNDHATGPSHFRGSCFRYQVLWWILDTWCLDKCWHLLTHMQTMPYDIMVHHTLISHSTYTQLWVFAIHVSNTPAISSASIPSPENENSSMKKSFERFLWIFFVALLAGSVATRLPRVRAAGRRREDATHEAGG